MNERITVWLIVVALVTSVIGMGFIPSEPGETEEAATNADKLAEGAGPMNVKSVEAVSNNGGVLKYQISFSGDRNRGHLERALKRVVDRNRIQASSVRVTNVKSHVATVEVVTDGSESSQTIANRMLHSVQLNASKTPATRANESNQPRTDVSEDVGVNYYQIDFVEGEPIENLRGPEGYYTPDRLIRYAHGGEQPISRSSDGEFTSNRELTPLTPYLEEKLASTRREAVRQGYAPDGGSNR